MLTDVVEKLETVAVALFEIEPLVSVTALETPVEFKSSVPPETSVVPVPSADALPTFKVPEFTDTPPLKVFEPDSV